MENNEEKPTEKHNKSEEKEEINGKKNKIKNWIKEPTNLYFLAMIILVIIIRFYYLLLTKNQPLWWDEAEYMSAAKNYAGIVYYELPGLRLPYFSMFLSLFFMIGVNEGLLMRFIVLFIPSILAILLLYLCVKEMYSDKRIALIAMAIFSVLWEHLFYSNRFHTENLSLVFGFLAILILLKVYMKKENLFFIKPKYSLIWIVLFCIISIIVRPGNMIFIPTIFVFILLLNQSYFLDRNRRIYSAIGLVLLLILSIIFISNIPNITLLKGYYQPENNLAWSSLSVFKGFYESLAAQSMANPQNNPFFYNIFYYAFWSFYYLFFLGMIFSVIYTVLIIDKTMQIKRDAEELEFKSNLFNFLLIISVLFYFIFMLRSQGIEYRWFFIFLPAMLAFTGKGIIIFSEFIGNLLGNKKIAIILIILISVLGVYNQLVHSDMIIKMKLNSYSQVKESGLWLKEHTVPSDVIMSSSYPQHTYYSEKRVYTFKMNETEYLEEFKKIKPKYIVVSVFEPGFTPQWAYNWPQRNNETVKPVQAYFLDNEQKQIALVIYEVLHQT